MRWVTAFSCFSRFKVRLQGEAANMNLFFFFYQANLRPNSCSQVLWLCAILPCIHSSCTTADANGSVIIQALVHYVLLWVCPCVFGGWIMLLLMTIAMISLKGSLCPNYRKQIFSLTFTGMKPCRWFGLYLTTFWDICLQFNTLEVNGILVVVTFFLNSTVEKQEQCPGYLIYHSVWY